MTTSLRDPSHVDPSWPTSEDLYAARIARRVASLREPILSEQHWHVVPAREVGDTLSVLVDAMETSADYDRAVEVFMQVRNTRARVYVNACVLGLMARGRSLASTEALVRDRRAILGLS